MEPPGRHLRRTRENPASRGDPRATPASNAYASATLRDNGLSRAANSRPLERTHSPRSQDSGCRLRHSVLSLRDEDERTSLKIPNRRIVLSGPNRSETSIQNSARRKRSGDPFNVCYKHGRSLFQKIAEPAADGDIDSAGEQVVRGHNKDPKDKEEESEPIKKPESRRLERTISRDVFEAEHTAKKSSAQRRPEHRLEVDVRREHTHARPSCLPDRHKEAGEAPAPHKGHRYCQVRSGTTKIRHAAGTEEVQCVGGPRDKTARLCTTHVHVSVVHVSRVRTVLRGAALRSAPLATLCIHFISFHFISFHFISFHFISFHFISFHFISFHFISFHFISFHFISFHFISFHFIFISFHFISFHVTLRYASLRVARAAQHMAPWSASQGGYACGREGVWRQHQTLSSANARETQNGLQRENRHVPISVGLCKEDVGSETRVSPVPRRRIPGFRGRSGTRVSPSGWR